MRAVTLLFFITTFISCDSSGKRPIAGETNFQIAQNAIFKDASTSPLTKKDLKNFKGLDFFPVDSSFIVEATIEILKDAPVFEMATTTDRKPLYKAYGVLSFFLDSTECSLTVYQNLDDLKNEATRDLLFLPFTDETSGDSSYGGGRYMDLSTKDISIDGKILLNFNNTYNPYCAYNALYSCPLTPRKNHLNIAITAGVKDFKK